VSNHSNNSNNQLSLYDSSLLDRKEKADKCTFDKFERSDSNTHLKKKRKYSMKNNGNNNGKRSNKKPQKNSSKNLFEDYDEKEQEIYKEEEDQDWCTPTCLFKKKNPRENTLTEGYNQWICCDSCTNWYHPKCVNMTKEEFELNKSEDKKWHCEECKNRNKL